MAGRILIADNVATNRIILKVKLMASRYETIQATSAGEVRRMARADRPDLVILDASLPGGAIETCAALKADPTTRTIPVLVLDPVPSRAARLAALRAGADDYLEKPLDEATLLALVRTLMRTRATFDELTRRQETNIALGFADAPSSFNRQPRLALVTPTRDIGISWRRALGLACSARITTLDKTRALDPVSDTETPDAYVIAADLDGRADGLRLISELRSRPATRHAAILVIDALTTPGHAALALDLGASAVMDGEIDGEEIAARLETLLARKMEFDALRESLSQHLGMAMVDPLTGVFNRRYAEAYLRRMASEAGHTNQPFALMMLDLDRFKEVNDSFGHRVGDEVLRETARRLKSNLREIDLVARYGGEEFLIAMPEANLQAALIAAERLRRVIGEIPIATGLPSAPGPEVPVTVSIGVTIWDGHSAQPALEELLEDADRALYASKHDGRNLVTFAEIRAA